jgi:hypothetical protein
MSGARRSRSREVVRPSRSAAVRSACSASSRAERFASFVGVQHRRPSTLGRAAIIADRDRFPS